MAVFKFSFGSGSRYAPGNILEIDSTWFRILMYQFRFLKVASMRKMAKSATDSEEAAALEMVSHHGIDIITST
jgi:hypothetical protein